VGVGMLVQKSFLGKLKDFGINSYEAKLWTALLSRGVATAGELSDIANVPRSRSYDVLESLEKKGFVIMKLGKPIKYIAVPPSDVVDRVKKRVQEDSSSQQELLDELKTSSVLQELVVLHKQGVEVVDPSELTGVLHGRSALYDHLSAGIKNAKKSVLIMTTAAGAQRKGEHLKNALVKAKEAGVKVKILAGGYLPPKGFTNIAQVKQTGTATPRFCVIDSNQVTIMALSDDAHPNYDFGIWVRTPSFAQSFEQYFNDKWDA